MYSKTSQQWTKFLVKTYCKAWPPRRRPPPWVPQGGGEWRASPSNSIYFLFHKKFINIFLTLCVLYLPNLYNFGFWIQGNCVRFLFFAVRFNQKSKKRNYRKNKKHILTKTEKKIKTMYCIDEIRNFLGLIFQTQRWGMCGWGMCCLYWKQIEKNVCCFP